jgi:hypothetical protein
MYDYCDCSVKVETIGAIIHWVVKTRLDTIRAGPALVVIVDHIII